MANKTSKSPQGTSFFDVKISATINQLTQILGKPTYDTPSGDGKAQKEWVCETSDGILFTIYDWKLYRSLENDEVITWHIGSHSLKNSIKSADEMNDLLEYFKGLNDTMNF
jgi:hypothetical protein